MSSTAHSGIIHKGGILHVENVAIPEIAAAVGTPFYCYSRARMLERYAALERALAASNIAIHYAVKANSNLAVIAALAGAGAGADVVSIGELNRSLAAGVPASRIMFAGVGKTADELAAALDAGILQINVESEAELRTLNDVAIWTGHTAPVGLRVNPDVDARTHAKISTGRKEDKFGVDIARAPDLFALAATLPGLAMRSLSVHIGSQLMDVNPYRHAYMRLRETVLALRNAGHVVDHLDLGGGLGIVYDDEVPPDLAAYGEIVRDCVGDLDCALSVEPGRFLVGDAGLLVTRVIYVKEGRGKRFIIADAAMNDLIRPTLYEAHHAVLTVKQAAAARKGAGPCDLVGPICESGDYISKDCILPDLEAGDLLAIGGAGAYGAVMASMYNSRPLVPEVMVNGDAFRLIRRRWSVAEAMALEEVPAWDASPKDDLP